MTISLTVQPTDQGQSLTDGSRDLESSQRASFASVREELRMDTPRPGGSQGGGVRSHPFEALSDGERGREGASLEIKSQTEKASDLPLPQRLHLRIELIHRCQPASPLDD